MPDNTTYMKKTNLSNSQLGLGLGLELRNLE